MAGTVLDTEYDSGAELDMDWEPSELNLRDEEAYRGRICHCLPGNVSVIKNLNRSSGETVDGAHVECSVCAREYLRVSVHLSKNQDKIDVQIRYLENCHRFCAHLGDFVLQQTLPEIYNTDGKPTAVIFRRWLPKLFVLPRNIDTYIKQLRRAPGSPPSDNVLKQRLAVRMARAVDYAHSMGWTMGRGLKMGFSADGLGCNIYLNPAFSPSGPNKLLMNPTQSTNSTEFTAARKKDYFLLALCVLELWTKVELDVKYWDQTVQITYGELTNARKHFKNREGANGAHTDLELMTDMSDTFAKSLCFLMRGNNNIDKPAAEILNMQKQAERRCPNRNRPNNR
eukprot:comp21382_c1_seq1/m.29415 comp21382_c1_seq1/g.29415  ORF comp21382_c1_seq1/g.29415 comp21382_c1_seq1/m.29415 type:complete len:340 (-) comp21382_c1_seq1:165-1184(-)